MTRQFIWALVCISSLINVHNAHSIQAQTDTIGSSTANKDKVKQQVILSINAIADAPRHEWAVEITNDENEEGDITKTIERYTPNKDKSKQWTLLSVNDKSPSKKQLKKYAKNKRAEDKKSDDKSEDKSSGNNFSIDLKTLIKSDTLVVLTDNPNYAELGFNVHMPKLGDDAVGKLKGVLTYNKQQQYIEKVIVTNNDDFSPMFSATVSQLKVSLHFVKLNFDELGFDELSFEGQPAKQDHMKKVEQNSVVLPKQYQMLLKGSFAYFTEIDETSTTTFDHYQKVSGLSAH